MFLNSDDLGKKNQDPKPAQGKLLLNFDDDDEDESEPLAQPQAQQKPNPAKLVTSKSYGLNEPQTIKTATPLKVNTMQIPSQNQGTQPKSGVFLSSTTNSMKTAESSIKSSGLPPALAAKLAALNKKDVNPNSASMNTNFSSNQKKEILAYNDDEIEDISNKYNNKGKAVLEKQKSESTEVYSRFKIPSQPNNNNSNPNENNDKSKNDALNTRQKLLEQQKMNFLEKQKMQLKNQTVVTSNTNYKSNLDNLKAYLPVEKPELDYEKLSVLVPKNESYYEPGKPNIKEPVVTKLTQHEKEKMKNITPTTLKLASFSDEEEDKIDENIIKEAQQLKIKAKQNQKEEIVIHTSRNTTRGKKNDEDREEDEGREKKKKDEREKDRDVEKDRDRENEEQKGEEEDEDDCNFGDAKPDPHFEVYDMRIFLTNLVPGKNGLKYLMSAKKRANNKTSNYMLSMNKDLKKKSSSYLGKLRSNFLGTEFIIYDTGLNPKETSDFPKMRLQLGVILYESNLLGERGPRKMRVLIPEIKPNGEYVEWRPTSSKDGMIANYNENNYDQMKVFANKEPQWNEEVQAFVLNFNGRVDKPSVKNFQLVDANDPKIIYMQFGRVGDSVFNLDYQYPFSALQAFAICLSSFDYKIACE